MPSEWGGPDPELTAARIRVVKAANQVEDTIEGFSSGLRIACVIIGVGVVIFVVWMAISLSNV